MRKSQKLGTFRFNGGKGRVKWSYGKRKMGISSNIYRSMMCKRD